MRDWLKRFGLSFFNDKYTRESVHCGFGMTLLTCLLAVLVLFFGVFTGKDALFSVDYDGASGFREFIYGAFAVDGLTLDIAVKDGKGDVTVNGEHSIINTLENADDAQRYDRNGYRLIVDHNDMTEAYDDFTVVCRHKSSGSVIDYSDYVELSATERSEYELEVVYSGTRRDISVGASEYETYLSAHAAAELKDIKEKHADDVAEYEKALYELYIKTYYPELKTLVGEDVPTLRRYYYDLIEAADGKYLCVFGDMIIGSFATDLGKKVRFGCVYTDFGIECGAYSEDRARAELDGFVNDLYYSNLSTLLFLEILNCLIFLAAFVLTVILITAACRAASALKKIEIGSSISNCVKAVGANIHVAALIAAVATVIFGFFYGGTAVTVFGVAAFAVTLAARLAVFYAREHAAQKKAADESAPSEPAE